MTSEQLVQHLGFLKLNFTKEHFECFAAEAAKAGHTHVAYLAQLMQGEACAKQDRATLRRINLARFPVIKTLDHFQWSWPTKINRPQIQNLLRLQFIEAKENVIFLGGVGLGKTHLSSAIGYQACLSGHSVLFTTAIEAINALSSAQAAGRLKQELRRFLRPALLILDELGYLPIDKHGADLLFQIISQRYERGSILVTSNRAYKHWHQIFNNDTTLTSAILDRLLHHSDTIQLAGKSFRMKDQIPD
jgi:DNA replication protein DnaC